MTPLCKWASQDKCSPCGSSKGDGRHGRLSSLKEALLSFLPLKPSAHGPAKCVITLCSFGLMQPGLTHLVPVALERGRRAFL